MSLFIVSARDVESVVLSVFSVTIRFISVIVCVHQGGCEVRFHCSQ